MNTSCLFVESDAEQLGRLQGRLRDRPALAGSTYTDSLDEATRLLDEMPFEAVVLGDGFTLEELTGLFTRIEFMQPDILLVIRREHELFQQVARRCARRLVELSPHSEAETIESVILNALLVRDWGRNPRLRQVSAQMTRLPSIPSLYLNIVQKLQSEDAEIEDVAVHISHDLAMCAKLLRLVNSAAFGLTTQVQSAFEAVMLLGFEQIKALILFSQLITVFDDRKPGPFSLDEFWLHSIGCANLARWIAQHETGDSRQANEAFTAGLLHDVGRLLIASNLPGVANQLASSLKQGEKDLHDCEEQLLGTNHAELGAYALAAWDLPHSILQAIGFHHRPRPSEPAVFAPLTAVHAANVLDYEKRYGASIFATRRVNREYLEGLFAHDPMDRWRSLAGIAPGGPGAAPLGG